VREGGDFREEIVLKTIVNFSSINHIKRLGGYLLRVRDKCDRGEKMGILCVNNT
jgi:hypothetical protein